MIGVIFSRADEFVEIRINGNTYSYRSTVYGSQFYPFDTLYLEKEKVISEFPDLKEVKNWRDIAMKRLKETLNSKSSEKEKINYIVTELEKIGYQPLKYQREGERVKKWLGLIR